jgi:tetratricopeptide (TPR) repeat protein
MVRNTALSVPDSPVSMMAAAPLVRVTADHLALVRSLINAGQSGRALELLDTVWHPRVAEEQCWYLRLWILAAEGRVVEALDLARVAAHELPGSAAVAYLQAALEHAADSPAAALEAAKRAVTIIPDHPVPAVMVALLSRWSEGDPVRAGEKPTDQGGAVAVLNAPLAPSNTLPNPVAAAQVGAALLFPLGSGKALLPAVASARSKTVAAVPASYDRRRFGAIALATVVCALWAIHDPVPAALVLSATVVLAARGWRS